MREAASGPPRRVALSPFARRLRTAPRQRAADRAPTPAREHIARCHGACALLTCGRESAPRRSGRPEVLPRGTTTHGQGVCSLREHERTSTRTRAECARRPRTRGPRARHPERTTRTAPRGRPRAHRAREGRALATPHERTAPARPTARPPRTGRARARRQHEPTSACTAPPSRAGRERRSRCCTNSVLEADTRKTYRSREKVLDSFRRARRDWLARTPKSSSRKRVSARLANVLVSSALRAGRKAFARAARTPERRKAP